MFNFDMKIEENSASFKDSENNKYVFIDSFDNKEFNVRMGTLSESKEVGTVTAKTTEELNQKLYLLIN